jgi:hypothetical protein
MAQTIQLNRNAQPVEVAGVRITAPTLQGSVTWHAPAEHRAMLATAAVPNAVDQAIAEANLQDLGSLEINAQTPARADFARITPSATAADEIQVEAAAAPGEAQFAIYRDESGIISLHFPLPLPVQSMRALASGAQPNHFYRIRLRQISAAAAPHGSGVGQPTGGIAPRAAMLGGIAGKVIRFLSPAKLVGDAIAVAAKLWEDHFRPEGFHGGADFNALLSDPPTPFNDWQSLSGQKALLFIHGTISSTAGAFAGLKNFQPQVQQLYAKYNNRVIGFNHHTLTKGVRQNIVDFFSKPSPGNYQFDVISHSRGGLVARALKTLRLDPPVNPANGVNVQIGKVALVGTPDIGTPLADPGDLAKAVSRLASIATAFPDAVALLGLGGLLAIAGGIVAGGLSSLPGLEDMNPGGAFLQRLNAAGSVADFFGIQADFVATGGLAQAIADDGFNALFLGGANDLVVPTLGVSNVDGVTLPAAQTSSFPNTARPEVCHVTYFFQKQTADALAGFLA